MRFPWRELPDIDPSNPPMESGFFKYIVGVVVPLALIAVTAAIVYFGRLPVRRASLSGGRGWVFEGGMQVAGLNAIALGVAGVSIAALVHISFYWGPRVGQNLWTDAVKILGLLGGIGGLVVLIIRIGVLNRL